jgi:membrane protein YqaA with SNARE-associated domain
MISALLALLLACGGCFALTTLSAVFPWVNAEFVVLMSSVVGFPPFIMTSLLAGAVRMNLARFLIAGAIGRLVRFGGVALAGNLVMRAF